MQPWHPFGASRRISTRPHHRENLIWHSQIVTTVFDYLLECIRPSVVFVHGLTAVRHSRGSRIPNYPCGSLRHCNIEASALTLLLTTISLTNARISRSRNSAVALRIGSPVSRGRPKPGVSGRLSEMGFDLEAPGRYFRWTNPAWFDLLELAKEFGWVPMGTGPPRGTRKAEWRHGTSSGDLDYYGNEGQRVYARDAARLADALERALAATPKRSPGRRKYETPRHRITSRRCLRGAAKPRRSARPGSSRGGFG